jgi:hypothetical protein
MGKALGDWEDRVRDILGQVDQGVIKTTLIDSAITKALDTFSNDRPLELQADLAGDGTHYLFTLPTGWVVGFSSALSVEYPQGQRPPLYLDMQEVHPYPDSDSATQLMFDVTTFATGQTARVTFTAPWPMPTQNAPTDDKVPSTDFDAVCHLAASYTAGWKAAEASANTRSSFPAADLSGLGEEADRWRAFSSWARKQYDQHIGSYGDGDEHPAPSSATFDWDGMSTFVSPLGGRYLTHRTRH